jgi:16S rRNA (cytosine967-C5)-methyltransferase
MIAPARRAAFNALLSVTRGHLDSATALARERRGLADVRDAALALELVSGTLRWQAALDAALDPLVTWPGRLDPGVRVALRLGAYQRLFLARVPPSAAVNDAVSLVREAGSASAAGLVNAVLRRLDPERARSAWPPRPTNPEAPGRAEAIAYLSITLSHPGWLVERWIDRHGFEAAEAWARFNNQAAPVTVWPLDRHTSRETVAARLSAAGVTAEPARWARNALYLTGKHPFGPGRGDRAFIAQDEASQLVAQLAVDLVPATVLDLCASPGGKTAYVRTWVSPPPQVVACDLRPRRLRLLCRSLEQAGIVDVAVVRADASTAPPFAAVFDLVLLDAPCSGLGTIRRDPEIRWRRQASDLAGLAAVQRRMIAAASTSVRPGGHLLYATCSSEPEENEEVVAAFLASDRSFERLPAAEHPWRRTPLAATLDARGDLHTLPHRHGLEAFHAAILRRTPGRSLVAR